MTRVGRGTLGVVLCVLGIILLWNNLASSPLVPNLADYWGIIPLLFGLELLYSSYLAGRSEPKRHVKVSVGSVIGLVIITAVMGSGSLVDIHFDGFSGFSYSLSDGAYHYANTVRLDQEVIPEEGVTRLVLEGVPGDWTFTGADGSAVGVNCDLEARGRTQDFADAAVSEARIVTRVDGSELIVSLDIPGWTDIVGTRDVNVRATATVSVPRDLDLAVDVSTGSVDVRDMGGDVKVDLSTGDSTLYNIGGNVVVDASTGDHRIENVGGQVVVDNSTGDVTVVNIGELVRVKNSTGSVTVSQPGAEVDVHLSTGDIEVSSDKPLAGDWFLRTSTGSLRAGFSQTSDLKLLAQVSTGSITSNLPFGTMSTSGGRKTIEGTLGDGTHMLTLDVITGDITVEQAGQ